MTLGRTEEHQILRQTSRDLVRRLDTERAEFSTAWEEFSALGLTSIRAPEAWGGVDMDLESLLVVVYELAQVRPDWAAALALHNHSAITTLRHCTSDNDVAPWASDLVAGAVMGTAVMNSDDRALGGMTDAVLGVRTSPNGDVLLHHALTRMDNTPLGFDDLRLFRTTSTLGNRVGTLASRDQETIATEGHLTWAALAVGLSQGALDVMVDYAQERTQFGQSLANFQGIQWMISDSSAETEAAVQLIQKALVTDEHILAYHAVIRAADIALSVTDRAIQVHGGYGFTQEYTPERFWRAAHHLRSGILDNSRDTLQSIAATLIDGLN